jgi:hypothetical protein
MTEQTSKLLLCKYCGEKAVVKYGKYKNQQRYFCKLCKRKYKSPDYLFHMKMPLIIVSNVLDKFYRGLTIFEIIKCLKEDCRYTPSRSLIHRWINKYTIAAEQYFMGQHPVCGDTWLINETPVTVGGRHNVYLCDIIDESTQYLLVSYVFDGNKDEVQKAIKKAIHCAGKAPKVIRACKYCDNIRKFYKACKVNKILFQKNIYPSVNLEDRFTITFNGNTQLGRPFMTLRTLDIYNRGWSIYYNYFKPNPLLNRHTPAEISLVYNGISSWHDLLLRL